MTDSLKTGNAIPCRKCLLEDLSDRSLYEQVQKTVAAIPEEERCADSEYRRRLQICRNCEELLSGMCLQCGCYVEVRAARQRSSCPKTKPDW
ncbi:MAG: hypothetical protein IKS18_00815 [Lachnospiraceae bacterium]|nr:hypothetical protein [Lachnospiraceae bacterium]